MSVPLLAPRAERALAALVVAVADEIRRLEEEDMAREEVRAERWRDLLRAAVPVLETLGVVGIGLPSRRDRMEGAR